MKDVCTSHSGTATGARQGQEKRKEDRKKDRVKLDAIVRQHRYSSEGHMQVMTDT